MAVWIYVIRPLPRLLTQFVRPPVMVQLRISTKQALNKLPAHLLLESYSFIRQPAERLSSDVAPASHPDIALSFGGVLVFRWWALADSTHVSSTRTTFPSPSPVVLILLELY